MAKQTARPRTRFHVNSLKAALHGVRYALTHELNFQIETVVGVAAIALGVLLGINQYEWLLLLLTIGLVLALELVNTGFERLADAQFARFNPQIKIAKDVGAAAVLVASIAAVAVGFWLFIPRLAEFFGIL